MLHEMYLHYKDVLRYRGSQAVITIIFREPNVLHKKKDLLGIHTTHAIGTVTIADAAIHRDM